VLITKGVFVSKTFICDRNDRNDKKYEKYREMWNRLEVYRKAVIPVIPVIVVMRRGESEFN